MEHAIRRRSPLFMQNSYFLASLISRGANGEAGWEGRDLLFHKKVINTRDNSASQGPVSRVTWTAFCINY